MRNPLHLYTILLCLFIFSCDTQPQQDEKQTQETQVIDHSTSENSLDYTGDYEGNLPCADCEKLRVKLALYEDKTFTKSAVYVGRSNEVLVEKGTYLWNATGTSIYLTNEEGEKQGYVVQENRIVMLDQAGNVIKGELADMYILNKVE